jgi:transposase
MRYLQGVERTQGMLLPALVEDYVTEENPVRAIDAFVEGLELGNLEIKERRAGESGAPGYAPQAMLKLYLYGYLNRIRSSRELEKAARRNLEVIWLLQQLRPDHWTINAFRKTHRKAFKKLFREFGLVCGSLGLFGAELVAIDGTHLKAVNAPQHNLTKAKVKKVIQELDAKSEAYLEALDTADREAEAQSMGKTDTAALKEKLSKLDSERARCQELMESLEQSETGQISQTDPDSRMLKKNGQSVVGYNAQVAVDAKNHLIVAEEVTQEPSDWKLLTPMAVAAKEALEAETLKVVADTGYRSRDQIDRCAENGIEPNVPRPKERGTDEGKYPLKTFQYDEEKDCYHCPQGKELLRHSDVMQHGTTYRTYYKKSACKSCPFLAKCTKGSYRKLWIPVESEPMKAMEERLRTQPELARLRSQTVEHVFGTIKFWWGFRSFLCRGLKAVRAEFSLAALAYNFRRVINIIGVEDLLAALRKGQPA